MRPLDVAIIGAGPYGLSVAAHLRRRDVDYAIFGAPMELWQKNMPAGMLLNTDGRSSNLSDPDGLFKLSDFCARNAVPYDPVHTPVRKDLFVSYGLAFKNRFGLHPLPWLLSALTKSRDLFHLHFDNGEHRSARNVVIAVGLLPFRHIPSMFAATPSSLVSHSSAFSNLAGLAGREVAILGAGASALDLAALLNEQGTRVTLITRSPHLSFDGTPPRHRSALRRMLRPHSKIGAGWLMQACDSAPQFIHALPSTVRHRMVNTALAPSAPYFLRPQINDRIEKRTATTITATKSSGTAITLTLQSAIHAPRTQRFDHLILATGYRLALERLGFLSAQLRAGIALRHGGPELSGNFESSVPGLFFTGFASAPAFGPVMRFLAGTPHPARRLAHHIHAQPRPVMVTAYAQA